MRERKVVLYIAMSLDGFIARENGDIDWLSIVEAPNQDYGYAEFIKDIDTVILGRKTYDKVLTFGIEFPHQDKQCYVITRHSKPSTENLIFYNGSLEELVTQLKSKKGKDIFVDGGAEIVNEMMKRDLIDEYMISIIPIFIGSGIPLFKPNRPEIRLKLLQSLRFNTGLVQLHYERIKKE